MPPDKNPNYSPDKLLSKSDALVLLISIVICFFNLLYAHQLWSYNSDDVSQQVLLKQWMTNGIRTTWLPADTFILKMPVHWCVALLLPNSLQTILVDVFIMNALNLAFSFIALKFILFRLLKGSFKPIYYQIPFLLFSTCGGTLFVHAIRDPNLRTIEIGLMFLLQLAIHRIQEIGIFSSKRNLIFFFLLALSCGIFFYNDPAFLFFFAAPWLLYSFLCLNFTAERVPALKIGLFFVLSFCFYFVVHYVFEMLGIQTVIVPAEFTNIQNLSSDLKLGIESLLGIFDADFLGLKLKYIGTFRRLLNFIILLIVFFASIMIAKKKRISLMSLYACQPLFLFGLYLLSNNSRIYDPQSGDFDLFSSRYMILIPFYSILIATIVLKQADDKTRRLLLWVFVLALCLNASTSSARAFIILSGNPKMTGNHNYMHLKIIEEARKDDLTKGYAGFWNANIVTYLAGNQVSVYSIDCKLKPMAPLKWLLNSHSYEQNTPNSFFIVSDEYESSPEEYGTWSGRRHACAEEDILKQFGQPAKVKIISAHTRMYIYNYDLKERMPSLNKNP